jgi:uncharacterized DUF497 family protein
VELDWDDGNRDHVLENGVEPSEAEEALLDPDRIGVSAYNVREETRWAALGRAEGGRMLFVVFTRRDSKVRVVTARDAKRREKRRYRRRGK